MHQTLLIHEIFEVIVAYAHLNAQSSVSALARTCKSLSGQALDALWEVQTSLGPLAKTLPEDLWHEEPLGRRCSLAPRMVGDAFHPHTFVPPSDLIYNSIS
jgi:hypothetical protein